MNRKIYYGVINAYDNAGRLLRWTGHVYDYVTKCGGIARTIASLEHHEFHCPDCGEIESRELRKMELRELRGY